MRWRLAVVGIVALLIGLVGVVVLLSAAPVGAAQHVGAAPAVRQAAFGLSTIVKKVILNERSSDGLSLVQPKSRVGPQIGRGLVPAWSGTDLLHRLNMALVSV